MSRKIREKVLTQWAPAFGIVSVMLYYALFIWRHALNVPYADDIFDVLQVLTGVVQSNDITQTIQLLFAQHVDHRTISSRLVYYLLLLITGEIDFRTLVFLANLGLPLLLLLFYLTIRHQPRPLLALFPAALILFQLRAYDLILWSMAAFAYIFVYVYALASLCCLRKVNVFRFMAALMFASLTSFSLASGQLIWLVGFASLLHQSIVLRRISVTYPVCWAFCAVLVLFVWHMEFVPMITMSSVLTFLSIAPLYPINNFFAMVGSAVSASNVVLAQSTGIVMLCFVAYYSVRSVAREDVTLELFAWYILMTVFTMAVARAPIFGVEIALASRYSFPSLLLAATIVVLVGSRLDCLHTDNKAGTIFLIMILLSAAFWLYSFDRYRPDLQKTLEMRVEHYNSETYWAFYADPEKTQSIVTEAILLRIYKPPARPHPQPSVVPPSKQK